MSHQQSNNFKITAVVVTYNRPDEILKVIKALELQTQTIHKIIVVDNASDIPVSKFLPESNNIEIHRCKFNSGGAGGFSKGTKIASEDAPDWIWLMDDDAVPREDALEKLLDASNSAPPNIGALCSSVYEFGKRANFHHRHFNFSYGIEKPVRVTQNRTMIEIDTGSFVGFLLSIKAVKAVGLPNPNFFIGYDDTEYSLRLKSKKWSLFLVPGSKIDHLIKQPTLNLRNELTFKQYYHIRNKIYVLRSYTKWPILGSLLGITNGIVIWKNTSKRYRLKNIFLLLRAIFSGVSIDLKK